MRQRERRREGGGRKRERREGGGRKKGEGGVRGEAVIK